jgi:hypothetical protein
MNKTLKAWLHGYMYFRVNGCVFYRYNTANAYADLLQNDVGVSVVFDGCHVLKGWRCFLVFYKPTTTTSGMIMNGRM